MKTKLALAVLLTLAFGCVPKQQMVKKQKEIDSCFTALAEENRKKKDLADATNELQAKVAELTRALDERANMSPAQLEELRKELAARSEEVNRLQTEKEELAKKSQTYDQLMSSLKEEIEEGKIKITEAKNRLSVELIDKVLFDSGSTEIKAEGMNALKKVASILRTVTDKQILVEGHTDNVPLKATLQEKFPTNWELSTARSTVVVRFLEDQGVNPDHLGAAGFSKFRPVAPNESETGRSQNRRIEIVLTPKVETLAARRP